MVEAVLEEYLEKTFSKIKANEEELDGLVEKEAEKTRKYNQTTHFVKLLITFDDNIKIEANVANKYDNRLRFMVNMIRESLQHVKRNLKQKITLSRVPFYLWFADSSPWITDVPIFVYATPSNHNLPLIPDHSYYCMQYDSKYVGKCINWDETKRLFEEHQSRKVIPKVYFKGSSSTSKRSNRSGVREALAKECDKTFKIDVDGFENFSPLYLVLNYKYYLDLPGLFPWSNRFKYLFLKDSGIVIKVNQLWKSLDDDWQDKRWVQLFDMIVSEEYYIKIDMLYYVTNDPNKKEQAKLLNKKENEKLILTIKKISKGSYRLPSAGSLINNLTMDIIYKYIFKCVLYSARAFKQT